jgi:membrane-associated protease RseP (regulator of RpoE activity)
VLPRVVPPAPPPPRWRLAIALFLATFFATTTLGAHWNLAARTDVISPIESLPGIGAVLSPANVRLVWGDLGLLRTGLAFSLPILFILLCHELGHYLACRHYRIDATLPYFIPAPLGLGTFGAFIRIRAPIRGKRELFDVGVAGPLAGFAALLPFLVYGIASSRPTAVAVALSPGARPLTALLVPGPSLAMELVTRLFHGPLPEGVVLDLHPFALAAWVGLLATALNLLPIGQLDGGHILYAVFGRRSHQMVLVLWLALLAAAFFFRAWLLWALIVLLLGLRHPPVADEHTPLDRRRLLLAFAALVMLVLCFMPVPLLELPLAG